MILDDIKKFVNKKEPTNKNPMGGKVPENDGECETQGVTDDGIINSAKWKTILNGAILIANTLTALKMAKLQRDLGKEYLRLAEDYRKYYNERFKPLETSLAKEALNLPKYVRNKEGLYRGQMLISARAATAGNINDAISCTGRYCTGQRAAILTDQLLEQASRESMVAGLAHRYVDKEEMVHNNLRWEKREQVMRIGRDIPTEAVSYASLASGIFGSIGEQAGKAAEGAAKFMGYNQQRRDTNYPTQRKPVAVSNYHYNPTQIREFESVRKKVFEKPEEPTQTIRVMG